MLSVTRHAGESRHPGVANGEMTQTLDSGRSLS